jgi:DNA-binding MarR family transcriptional regulator/GNAT superfamily N-acetyltransferase
MHTTLAGSTLSQSAAHAILEIARHGSLTASALSTILRLEKSSVSRLVQKLIRAGIIVERADPRDSRIKHLALTARGRRTRKQIDVYARGPVSRALHGLPEESAGLILQGLRIYADRLSRSSQQPGTPPPIRITTGYRPGIVGKMVEMQARYYAAAAGFRQPFESKRAADIAEFAARLDAGPRSARTGTRNQLWIATQFNRVVGTIVIDADTHAPAAYLRWFMVDESMQGRGIGKKLMRKALDYCKAKGFPEIHLETFEGLDAARHLYEVAGFKLISEEPVTRWSRTFVEQQFVLPLRDQNE